VVPAIDTERYARIYELAEPYWQTRSNGIHVPGSYALAQALLAAHPEADPDVVLPAVLLHDVGYMAVPAQDHLKGLAGAVGSEIDRWLFTDAARSLARRELAASRMAIAAEPVR
jgi:HD superfamily phosphodiesterase